MDGSVIREAVWIAKQLWLTGTVKALTEWLDVGEPHHFSFLHVGWHGVLQRPPLSINVYWSCWNDSKTFQTNTNLKIPDTILFSICISTSLSRESRNRFPLNATPALNIHLKTGVVQHRIIKSMLSVKSFGISEVSFVS